MVDPRDERRKDQEDATPRALAQTTFPWYCSAVLTRYDGARVYDTLRGGARRLYLAVARRDQLGPPRSRDYLSGSAPRGATRHRVHRGTAGRQLGSFDQSGSRGPWSFGVPMSDADVPVRNHDSGVSSSFPRCSSVHRSAIGLVTWACPADADDSGGHRTVRRFRFNGPAVGACQHRRHQAERTEACATVSDRTSPS